MESSERWRFRAIRPSRALAGGRHSGLEDERQVPPASVLIIGNEPFLCPEPMSNIELSRLLAFAAPPGARFRGRATAYSGPGTVIDSGGDTVVS